MKRSILVLALVLALPLAFGACNSSSSVPVHFPVRLYAASFNDTGPTVGEVNFYASPFGPSTVEGGAITSLTGDIGVAVDPTNPGGPVFVSSAGTIAAYVRPTTTSSTVAFTVKTVSTFEINFDANGNLYYPNFSDSTMNKITHPITGPSSSSVLITHGVTSGVPQCATADAAGNLFVLIGGTSPHIAAEFAPPYTLPPVTTTSGMSGDTDPCALDPVTGQFFVGNITGTIVGFNTPITSGEAPAVTIGAAPSGGNGDSQFGFAFDPFGNLYVASETEVSGTGTGGKISVYVGPTISDHQSAAFSFPNVEPSSPTSILEAGELAIGI